MLSLLAAQIQSLLRELRSLQANGPKEVGAGEATLPFTSHKSVPFFYILSKRDALSSSQRSSFHHRANGSQTQLIKSPGELLKKHSDPLLPAHPLFLLNQFLEEDPGKRVCWFFKVPDSHLYFL